MDNYYKLSPPEYDEIYNWIKKLSYRDWKYIRNNFLYSNWEKSDNNGWINDLTIKDNISELISDLFIYLVGVVCIGMISLFVSINPYLIFLGGGVFYLLFIKYWYRNDQEILVNLFEIYYNKLKIYSDHPLYYSTHEGVKTIVDRIFEFMDEEKLNRQQELLKIRK